MLPLLRQDAEHGAADLRPELRIAHRRECPGDRRTGTQHTLGDDGDVLRANVGRRLTLTPRRRAGTSATPEKHRDGAEHDGSRQRSTGDSDNPSRRPVGATHASPQWCWETDHGVRPPDTPELFIVAVGVLVGPGVPGGAGAPGAPGTPAGGAPCCVVPCCGELVLEELP